MPIHADKERIKSLEDNLFIVFSGISRFASEAAKTKVNNISKTKKELLEMKKFVFQAIDIIKDKKNNIDDFGELLNDSWKLKKKLSNKITNKKIDNLFSIATESGASGGKLLGAGGGGFLLFYVKSKYKSDFISAMSSNIPVPINFDVDGSKIILEEN